MKRLLIILCLVNQLNAMLDCKTPQSSTRKSFEELKKENERKAEVALATARVHLAMQQQNKKHHPSENDHFQGKDLRASIQKIIESQNFFSLNLYTDCIKELAHWYATHDYTKDKIESLKHSYKLFCQIKDLKEQIHIGKTQKQWVGNLYLTDFGYPDDGNDYDPDKLTLKDIGHSGRLK